jgi:hypothetical protein
MANFSKQAALQQLAVIGVPCGAGACGIGQERTPSPCGLPGSSVISVGLVST